MFRSLLLLAAGLGVFLMSCLGTLGFELAQLGDEALRRSWHLSRQPDIPAHLAARQIIVEDLVAGKTTLDEAARSLQQLDRRHSLTNTSCHKQLRRVYSFGEADVDELELYRRQARTLVEHHQLRGVIRDRPWAGHPRRQFPDRPRR